MMLPARILLLLLLSSVPAALSARGDAQGAAERILLSTWLAEFPLSDVYVATSLEMGLASKRADRLLRDDPFSAETVRALVTARREDDALRAARQILDKHPERAASVLDALSRLVPGAMGQVPGRDERLRALLDHARARMTALDTNERAAAAYALFKAESALLRSVPRPRYTEGLKEIAAAFRGTPAALEAEVDAMNQGFYDDRGQSLARQEELLAFARAHHGTSAGAKALYQAAFHVASNASMLNLAPVAGGGDPTERFLLLLGLVHELQDGRYPTCEWTDRGDELVTGFSVYKATYSPENIDRLLNASTIFVTTRWKLDLVFPDRNGVGYFITSKVAELYKAKGEGVAGFENFLTALEAKVPDPLAVHYLRAHYYLTTMASEPLAGAKAIWLEKARRTLEGIEARAGGFYRRKATAILAAVLFQQREFPAARDRFAKYLREYPESPYAWLAAIRLGQCEQLTGNWAGALSAYQAVPAGGDAAAVPGVLAAVLAGRAQESLGDPVKALAQFRQALARWDPAFGESYYAGGPPALRPVALPYDTNAEFRAIRLALESRVSELARTTANPGGVALERARWLLTAGRWQEAAKAAEQVVAQHPSSPNVPEARSLGHRALLGEALDKADVERPGATAADALPILERLSKEPFDFAVCVGGLARAYIASGAGASAEGEKLLLETLAKWRAHQDLDQPLTPLEQDVKGIRSAVFLPMGGSIYAGTRWNGMTFPPKPAPFAVTRCEVRVKTSDGKSQQLSFLQRFPHLDNVLFLDEAKEALVNTLMTKLGGTKARQGEINFEKGYMETPNQPIGPSLGVMAFLNKGFNVMPGHWGGWHFVTFPVITELLFIDEPRTRALARIRVGYAGGDVLLEKQGGEWKATKLTQTWVE